MGVDGGKILLVDDEPAIRVLVARQLTKMGFTPVVAATAEEALALSQNETFRVVITDLEMSGMGGLALLSRLSPLQPQARFLVLTGRGPVPGELLPRGHRIKIFSKPWDERELAAAVKGTDGGTSSSSLLAQSAPSEWPKTHVLLIESDESDALAFCARLEARHPAEFTTTVASDAAAAQSSIERHTFDVIVFALPRANMEGLEAVSRLQGEAPHLGIVVIAPTSDAKFAVQAIQAGARECLVKSQLDALDIGRALRLTIERKRTEWRLANIAYHDPLTGLPNRSLFRQRVAQAAAFAKRSRGAFAVLVLDMDRFKFINDSLGHDSGDVFLQETAHRLQAAMRETDTVARLGGDEFAVLATPLAEPVDIEPLAERILAELRRPIDVGGTCIYPTASIGAALFPTSGTTSDGLLSAADAALYVVKENGRNGFNVHGVELKRRVLRKLKLEEQIRRAVEQKQFHLHFQPQVSLETDFLGAEALLRWAPSVAPPVEIGELMRMLEDTGLILELGPWIIEQACRQLRQWRERGLWVNRVAINVSARQVLARSFIGQLRRATRDASLHAGDVELELSEDALQRGSKQLSEAFAELAADGYRLALDDFGTGYCALAHLKNLSITTLKMDKRFVRSIAIDAYDRNLASGIIRLVNQLGLEAVAVGVETPEQLELLSAEGCSTVQGFLIGAPMPPAEFAAQARRLLFGLDEGQPTPGFVSRRVARARASRAPLGVADAE